MNLATCFKVDCPSSLENKENSGILYPLGKVFLCLLPLDMSCKILDRFVSLKLNLHMSYKQDVTKCFIYYFKTKWLYFYDLYIISFKFLVT